jgi:hypothetical protein
MVDVSSSKEEGMAPPKSKKKFAEIEVEKHYDNPDDPQMGEFHFTWKAALMRGGTKNMRYLEVRPWDKKYQSGNAAFRAAITACESLGYTILNADRSHWMN